MADEELHETWQRLMGLLAMQRDAFFAELHGLGLTPPHGHALMSVHGGGPTKMRDLAQHMSCDASYITNVADRLEELGFAERRTAPDDRRVKELVLTPRGEQVARRLQSFFLEPPEAIRRLSAADQKALGRITRQLVDVPASGWMPPMRVR